MTDDTSQGRLGPLLGLFVHDARNPLSAAVSNISYLLGELESQEHREALEDTRHALATLTLFLEQLAWLATAMPQENEPAGAGVDAQALVKTWSIGNRTLKVSVEGQDVPMFIKGGTSLAWGLSVAEDVASRAGASAMTISLSQEASFVRVDIEDDGGPVDPETSASLFDPDAQFAMKDRSAGRYARGLGWVALANAVRSAGGAEAAAPASRGIRITLRYPACP